MLEDLVHFVDAAGIQSITDRVFAFGEDPAAYDYNVRRPLRQGRIDIGH